MKCITHPSHSGIGVCAFCLRDRLSSLTSSPAEYHDVSSPERHRNANRSPALLNPPPLSCQVSSFSNLSVKNRSTCKFSLLSPIWGNTCPRKAESSKPSGSKTSWLMSLNLGRIKRNKKRSPHVQPVSGRGLSPAADLSPRRGVSFPSPLCKQQSPSRFSSFGLCLSPMVRPIPGNKRGQAPPETAFSGEIRGAYNRRCVGSSGAVVHELSPCLMMNRSRKLVDLGRVW